MKKTDTNVTRRRFLTKGAGIAAVSSIIAIETSAETKELNNSNAVMLPNEVVYTEQVQTLTNKTISAGNNTLIIGTEHINIKQLASFPTMGNDITNALNEAINLLSPTGTGAKGGHILIPRGNWTSNGGHDFADSITIEGAGIHENSGSGGTEIFLTNNDVNSYMFRIITNRRNCTLKNLSIKLGSRGIGLFMTNIGSTFNDMKLMCVENVSFHNGAFGIKVESASGTDFECIVNDFERVSFIDCKTAFYCNSSNSGYNFNNCYFRLRTPNGIALDCDKTGNLSLNHCLFVGTHSPVIPWAPVMDNSIILRTKGAFNNISFYDCQDENIQYCYRNSNLCTNVFAYVPIVFRSCLIQSTLLFTTDGSVVFDSCRIGVPPGTVAVADSLTSGVCNPEEINPPPPQMSWGSVRIYLKGLNNFYTQNNANGGILQNFQNPDSMVIYESQEIGKPIIMAPIQASYNINATRGIFKIPIGANNVEIFNRYITPDTLVFAQLRDYVPSGPTIKSVQCNVGSFHVWLTQNATTNLSVGFIIEG